MPHLETHEPELVCKLGEICPRYMGSHESLSWFVSISTSPFPSIAPKAPGIFQTKVGNLTLKKIQKGTSLHSSALFVTDLHHKFLHVVISLSLLNLRAEWINLF